MAKRKNSDLVQGNLNLSVTFAPCSLSAFRQFISQFSNLQNRDNHKMERNDLGSGSWAPCTYQIWVIIRD